MMNTRFIVLFIVFYGVVAISSAQEEKRPQIQQSSIWMDNFEADGKLDEWKQPLQADNDDTKIQYNLANDESYLYF